MGGYWITPPDLYAALDAEFAFDFDPCPFPRPKAFDGLAIPWGQMNYVNPPFNRADAATPGGGLTAFVRKAIEERRAGRSSVLLLPTYGHLNLLLDAGAELRSASRTHFIHTETGIQQKHKATSTLIAILRAEP